MQFYGEVYYLIIDNEKMGPYLIVELLELNINNDSLVWREGLENGTQAGMLQELKQCFIKTFQPSPIPIKDYEKSNKEELLKHER